ncbi:cupin domain-containing protein [Mesorhizobium sp. M9A.F.Ca.ET.002.03.1.2]|uniref:cupin domain-containing protein n=1 Tax=Mesorhizobium sp. M9A.F.Ca.ET.002.03.1.2 TaxID=2493668 RepID=UPI001FE0152E|nr:cupin domain-containing protein [Mesorhizobium sp. M9A.F.Ca.ET.002.03.1.2]
MSDIDSKTFVLAGIVMKRLLSGEQTAGQFCLFENKSDGNTRTPIHVHAKDDETVYIIEGELTAVIDGQPRRLTAGESIFLPRGITCSRIGQRRRWARKCDRDLPQRRRSDAGERSQPSCSWLRQRENPSFEKGLAFWTVCHHLMYRLTIK